MDSEGWGLGLFLLRYRTIYTLYYERRNANDFNNNFISYGGGIDYVRRDHH